MKKLKLFISFLSLIFLGLFLSCRSGGKNKEQQNIKQNDEEIEKAVTFEEFPNKR